MIRKRSVVFGVACAVSLALLAGLSRAQDEKKGTETKSAEKGKVRKASLPDYFAKIGLTEKKEDEVRKIVEPFNTKIADLKKQIKELEKQVDEQEAAKEVACEKVLNEAQRALLKEHREEAAAKKKSSKKTANGDKEEKK